MDGSERHLVWTLPRVSRERYRVPAYALNYKGALVPQLYATGIRVIALPGLVIA